MVTKGSWVSLRKVLLEPEQRTGKIPEETRAVPLTMWVKGTLQADAEIGDTVEILTHTGRKETGVLEAVNPQYEINFGNFVPELLRIGDDARALLKKGGAEE